MMRRDGLGMEACEMDKYRLMRRQKEITILGKKVSDFLWGVRKGTANPLFRKRKTKVDKKSREPSEPSDHSADEH
jgi:hypothetical protein